MRIYIALVPWDRGILNTSAKLGPPLSGLVWKFSVWRPRVWNSFAFNACSSHSIYTCRSLCHGEPTSSFKVLFKCHFGTTILPSPRVTLGKKCCFPQFVATGICVRFQIFKEGRPKQQGLQAAEWRLRWRIFGKAKGLRRPSNPTRSPMYIWMKMRELSFMMKVIIVTKMAMGMTTMTAINIEDEPKDSGKVIISSSTWNTETERSSPGWLAVLTTL